MLKKYTVEYSLHFRKNSPPEHHQYFTDDPVALEDFLQSLLENGMGLHAIKHEGADLPKVDFDRLVKIAASEVASLFAGRSTSNPTKNAIGSALPRRCGGPRADGPRVPGAGDAGATIFRKSEAKKQR